MLFDATFGDNLEKMGGWWVAGDIIKTVAIEPTMDSVLVLAIIVLVRTVLSLSLDVEIDGRWPWDADRLKLR